MSNYNPILMYAAEDRTKQKGNLKTAETAGSTNVQLTSGVGQISSVGVTFTKEVKGTIAIDMTYSTFSSSAYEKCTEELKNTVSSEKYENLKESQRKSDYKSWWFWLFSASEQEFENNKNQTIFTKNVEDTEISKVIEKMFSEEQQDYHIEGKFEVEGQSMIQTRAEMYISTLNIQTSEYSGVSVIDTTAQPILLDPNTGSPANVSVENKEKFNIVPVSGSKK